MNDNLLGRITALALILGAAFGVHAIARGGFSCPLGRGSCCLMAVPQDASVAKPAEAPVEKPAAAALNAPGADDEATLSKKAPVVPPAAKAGAKN
jgi:hypothetical protein